MERKREAGMSRDFILSGVLLPLGFASTMSTLTDISALRGMALIEGLGRLGGLLDIPTENHAKSTRHVTLKLPRQ